MARRSATHFKAMKLPTRAETTNYQGQSLRDKVLQHRKRVIVTPAVYPRLDEPLHFDIQSTGQKSHCVNISL